jgi:polyisoprenoid-binding protein YceI
VTGNFQLHGVVRSISFPATINVEPGKVTVNAEFVIKRFDFKIEYPGPADNLIRDEVVIKLDLIGVPAAEA